VQLAPEAGVLEAGYGILIYTGTSDAEGTLGGLIEAGKQVARHLETPCGWLQGR